VVINNSEDELDYDKFPNDLVKYVEREYNKLGYILIEEGDTILHSHISSKFKYYHKESDSYNIGYHIITPYHVISVLGDYNENNHKSIIRVDKFLNSIKFIYLIIHI
jgi:hypothetical protein